MSPCVCSSQFNHNRTNLNRSFPLNTMIRRQSLGKEPIKSLTAAHRASLRANDPDVLNAAYAVQQEQAETEKVPETANNESKQFKRSLSASIPPFSRQLVFTSMDFIFEEEVWENESWKTVRRIWSSPMLGVPNYAKRGNETLRLPDGPYLLLIICFAMILMNLAQSIICRQMARILSEWRRLGVDIRN